MKAKKAKGSKARAKRTKSPKKARNAKKVRSTKSAGRAKLPPTKRARKKPALRKKPKPARREVASPPAPSSAQREITRLQNVRSRLERRLTALVQEIGYLRQYEMRTRILEAELKKRDQELETLRRQNEERIRAQVDGPSVTVTDGN